MAPLFSIALLLRSYPGKVASTFLLAVVLALPLLASTFSLSWNTKTVIRAQSLLLCALLALNAVALWIVKR